MLPLGNRKQVSRKQDRVLLGACSLSWSWSHRCGQFVKSHQVVDTGALLDLRIVLQHKNLLNIF